MERSAEFLRGAKWWADQHTTGYTQLCALLAAAEARESFPIPDTLPAVPEVREAGERKQSADDRLEEALNRIYAKYGPRLDLFFADVDKAREAVQLTAAEVIAACEKHISDTLEGMPEKIDPRMKYREFQYHDYELDEMRQLLDLCAQWKEANHGK